MLDKCKDCKCAVCGFGDCFAVVKELRCSKCDGSLSVPGCQDYKPEQEHKQDKRITPAPQFGFPISDDERRRITAYANRRVF